MSRFFIERPIFAAVLAIVVMLGGLLAVYSLPISQYPQISPTTVSISATYTGADAQTVENTVTKVIEQGMTGIDYLDYMTSTSSQTGSSSITLTFTNEADPDVAQMQVQNKLQLVESQLPTAVTSTGVTVTKSSDSFLMVIGFVSNDGSLNNTDLSDWVDSNLQDRISRLEGVGSTRLFGAEYAMRIWLDPSKLQKYALMPSDVTSAITAQNTQVSAGQLGARPQLNGQLLNVTVTAKSRLQTISQFENIILKSSTDGSMVRLNDVARVEVGASSYNTSSKYNGKPAAGLGVYLATGANAISTATAVKNVIADVSPTLPAGVEVVYPYDTTPFVELSIEEVVRTLFEAIILVFVVMFVFLQNFRATLIPTLAVPVVLLGTFGMLAVFGYSINTLTMFAMVLAIGLLVDDAIVVVENVERVMEDDDVSPKQATIMSMKEITGALVGIATVLSAVFIPMAFFGGSVGVIYRQFSVTIVTAMLLSVLVALILTPALCATLLKRPKEGSKERGIFGFFNRNFDRTTRGYRNGVRGMLLRPIPFIVLFVAMVGAAGMLFGKVPSAFIPQEDQGILIASIQLPQGATSPQTDAVIARVRKHFLEDESEYVKGVMSVAGFGFGGQGQNVGLMFIRLKDFAERNTPQSSASAIAGRAMGVFSQFKDSQVFALSPPAIPGFGVTGGFDLYLQDANGQGHEKLVAARNELLGKAAQSPLLANTRPNGMEDSAQYHVDIDEEKASSYSLSLSDIYNTLSSAWGGTYVNDFIYETRIKSVYVQGDAKYRMQPEDIDKWYVRNSDNDMVPFSAFAKGRWTFGSPRLERFNGLSAVEIQGSPGAGATSGLAMNEIERLIKTLPQGYSFEWVGLSAQEQIAGNQAVYLYLISTLVVFLALAALYESWSIPFAVMLTVPIGILGALVAALLFDQSNDVYFKVGMLTTIGLAAKNAILIVEFAIDWQKRGKDLFSATLEAARQRLRPIIMTSLAFILGVTPLAIASGAGSGSQNAIGIAVMGGMIASTVIGVFFAPLLFVLVRKIFPGKHKGDAGDSEGKEAAEGEGAEA
ncbi:multidrug efflux pump [Breoghania corrubedonensis]|uniref:Efflux pump membrane transporter n=1 Tax=Breoghania corrubedonensis TaxID=665038 RepID=A0A2T5V9N5_9HYPH|nr:efflux RND transporter permease subunit [Breoghania corrubedonensis]PTW60467.1 multidrug efflux pump [Breoghania corrubedonensis]